MSFVHPSTLLYTSLNVIQAEASDSPAKGQDSQFSDFGNQVGTRVSRTFRICICVGSSDFRTDLSLTVEFSAHSDMGSEIEVVQAKISDLEDKLDAGTVPEAERIFVRQEIVELRKKENILLQGGHVFRLLKVFVRM